MTVVVDASVVVAALTDNSRSGRWAAEIIDGPGALAAPHHMPVEVAMTLCRAQVAGALSQDVVSLAHHELLDLSVQLHEYGLAAARVWQLRHNVTPYDAWYIAVAEALDAPLATLDLRLTRASGPRCEFLTPSV